MFRLRKSTKYIIIIAVIIAAGYLSVKLSGINNILHNTVNSKSFNDNQADRIFTNLDNEIKIKMIYNTVDLSNFNREIKKLYSGYAITPLYSNITANFYVSLFTYNVIDSDSVMFDLRKLKILNREYLETADPDNFKINIEDHIANKERIKRSLEKKIDNAILISDDRISNFNQELTRVQLEIDSLMNQRTIIRQLANNNLVYLIAKKVNPAGAATLQKFRLKLIKNFVLYFLIFLAIGVFLLIVMNYFFILLLKLMSLLGIRTSRSSSGGYSYGGQSYRSKYYYRRPKKVKRVYKDEKGNIIKQKVTKE